MAHKLKCFLSYAHVDQEFVKEEIAPVLSDLGLDVWVDYEQIASNFSIADVIAKAIRQANIVVAIFNRRSTYMSFEVGAAMGQNKPTLAILRGQDIPFDLRHISFLRYSETEKQAFHRRLYRAVEIIANNLIDKSVIETAETDRVIGIEIGANKSDIERELRFTADFLSLIKKVSGAPEPALVQTRKGSFTSFFSIDLKSWADPLCQYK